MLLTYEVLPCSPEWPLKHETTTILLMALITCPPYLTMALSPSTEAMHSCPSKQPTQTMSDDRWCCFEHALHKYGCCRLPLKKASIWNTFCVHHLYSGRHGICPCKCNLWMGGVELLFTYMYLEVERLEVERRSLLRNWIFAVEMAIIAMFSLFKLC